MDQRGQVTEEGESTLVPCDLGAVQTSRDDRTEMDLR